jgi:hypothetical protein
MVTEESGLKLLKLRSVLLSQRILGKKSPNPLPSLESYLEHGYFVTRDLLMAQSGSIKLDTCCLTDCKPNWTPAAKDALGIDPDGPPMNESWSYPPSVVGMLLYLSINTRPNICFAVSQVC